ncbi:dTMP kinase [Streptomyces sp. NPDC049577]|uniref:dTMP kinase n=1 Tax=Streptomyces sp. NPDC049577 TaxID=3155153 RepID=UPI00342019D9
MLVGALLLPVAAVVLGKTDDRHGVTFRRDLMDVLKGGDPAQAPSPTGFFIAFEGGDGAGKSTQVQAVADWIRAKGHEVVVTREPGATPIGKRLRAILLDVSSAGISDRAEALLYAADRAEHVDTVVRPALERGAVVISDRYIDSSVAYQGAGRDLSPTEIARISRWATDGLVPNLTVLLDVSPEAARERFTEAPDRLESEPAEFHQRVRSGFLALAAADPARYLVVDAAQAPEAVTTVVRHRLDQLLPLSEAEIKAREEARRAAEEEARRKAEEEAARRAEEERLERERQEQLAKLRAEEEERKRREAEEAARREAERQAEEARKRAEEARKAAEEERARREAEERARAAEQERLRKQAEEEARLRAEAEELRREKQRKAEEALLAAERARLAAEAEAAAAAEAEAGFPDAGFPDAGFPDAGFPGAGDAPTVETPNPSLHRADPREVESAPGTESRADSGTAGGADSGAEDETAVLPPVWPRVVPPAPAPRVTWGVEPEQAGQVADSEETAVLPKPGAPGAEDRTEVLPPVRAEDRTEVLPPVREEEPTEVLPPVRPENPADRVPDWLFRPEDDASGNASGNAAGRGGGAAARAGQDTERTRELPHVEPGPAGGTGRKSARRRRPEWAEEEGPTLADELLGSRDTSRDEGRRPDGGR